MNEFSNVNLWQVVGDGSVAQSVLSSESKGQFLSINWGWGVAVMLGILVSINVSGKSFSLI